MKTMSEAKAIIKESASKTVIAITSALCRVERPTPSGNLIGKIITQKYV